MGIESGPKVTPEENNDSTDSQESVGSTSNRDWSRVEKIMEEKRQSELAAMSPEDRKKAIQEDERIQKQAEEIRQWSQGKQKKLKSPEIKKDATQQTEKEVGGKQLTPQASKSELAHDKMVQKMEQDNQTIREQEYQKVKAEMERFRGEHGIQKTAEELAEEDRELRNKFGLE